MNECITVYMYVYMYVCMFECIMSILVTTSCYFTCVMFLNKVEKKQTLFLTFFFQTFLDNYHNHLLNIQTLPYSTAS